VVEEDAVTGEKFICFTVIHGYPVGVELGSGVRAAGREGGDFV